MGKFADRYFGVDPWLITESGFDPSRAMTAESVFSLGNEHMGVRGYFDEGYSGQGLQGSYVNGVYERREAAHQHYCGVPGTVEFMVNAADWLRTSITCLGQRLDLNTSSISDYTRTLDMRSGELTRAFVWHVNGGTDIRLTFERVLSMEYPELGASRISWKVLRGDSAPAVCPELVFSEYWDAVETGSAPDFRAITGTTKHTKQRLYASAYYSRSENTLTRIAHISRVSPASENTLKRHTYEGLRCGSHAWWSSQWAHSDVEIDGPDDDQQGIRYSIFQMHQTNSGRGRVVIGAKGLTGEAYNGNTFWDTEIYCLPFYLFTNPEAAKSILRFRYETLGEAMDRAKELNLGGAFYPIATISGRECCTLWQHANTQLQASTAVAYAIWHYTAITGDDGFLQGPGLEMLTEICRMLASRGSYDPLTGEYGYYGVMGPDEFQLMVNHNRYTNYLAKKTFLFTLEALQKSGAEETQEHRDWRQKADAMRAGYDAQTLLYEQHDGFFHLPHVDVSSIPAEEFPLYHHWAYDKIFRNDIIKQPDVLMFMFLYPDDFSISQLAANFDYYEPRCIHESSLSPSVHSILACRIGRLEQAYELFRFASRLDLDNYNRNTNEGLHTTSIAGSWMNIVYGFAGLCAGDGCLALNPALPGCWRRLRFRIKYRGSLLRVEITHEGTEVRLESGPPVSIKLRGENCPVRSVLAP